MSYDSYISTWKLNNSIAICHDPKYGERPKLCPRYKECAGASIICGEHFTGNREKTAERIPLSEFDYTKGGTGWNSVIRDEDINAFLSVCSLLKDDGDPFNDDFFDDDKPSQSEIDDHVSGAENGNFWDKCWCDDHGVDYDHNAYWENL